ncbi:MAG: hypothetical protein E6Q97_14850 [Desulfurellales bacterium]|nr:MAG: hypothetical protein E6Q97_14850 [Desulfurellales bacterium]
MKELLNPWVILGIVALLALTGAGSYIKGRSDGKTVERNLCNAGKAKAAETNLDIKKKQDAVRAAYPDNRALLKRLRNGTYP